MDPNLARRILRRWPVQPGQSELKKLLSIWLPDTIGAIDIVPGLTLHIPSYRDSGRIFWWFEEVEAALQFYMARYLPVGGRVIDVGASTGLLGLWAARHKSCHVVLVEVQAALQAALEETLRLNPKLRELCSLIKAACSDAGDPRFHGQRTVRLDALLEAQGWDHVDLIKIDTDGHELGVLRSLGARLTPQSIDALFIEMTGRERPLFDLLRDRGFCAYGVRRTRLPELRRLGRNEVEAYWFRRVEGLLGEDSPFENFLWVAAAGPLRRHLDRWCEAGGDVRHG
jgi:hypothetical protein